MAIPLISVDGTIMIILPFSMFPLYIIMDLSQSSFAVPDSLMGTSATSVAEVDIGTH